MSRRKGPRTLKQALRERQAWNARGSDCPICRREFRGDACPHSVGEARAVLNARVMAAAQRERGGE